MYHCTLGPLGLTLREPHANGAGHLVSGLVAGGMAEMKGVQTGRSVGWSVGSSRLASSRLALSIHIVCCVLISVCRHSHSLAMGVLASRSTSVCLYLCLSSKRTSVCLTSSSFAGSSLVRVNESRVEHLSHDELLQKMVRVGWPKCLTFRGHQGRPAALPVIGHEHGE